MPYVGYVLRTHGARLAVPLSVGSIILLFGLFGITRTAEAAGECRRTAQGIVCAVRGSSPGSSRSSTVRAPAQPVVRKTVLPPMRYLATSSGRCWFWSRYPPGYDSWNPRYDQSIIVTRSQLPQCRGSSSPPPAPVVVTVDIPGRAWSIFRSFPLDAPDFRLSPMVGITNLPSRLHLVAPSDFAHGEGLPDGRRLEVRARVESVVVEWGDGRKDAADPLGMVGDPGPVRHTYLLKTCTPSYRQHHLDGPKCHPSLDRYPVTVTFEWVADYRVGGSWVRLGTIDRPSDLPYDVDEVLGVLVDL